MSEQELKDQAIVIYALIGEYTIKRKQLKQQMKDLDEKLKTLEMDIVNLSIKAKEK